MFSYWHYAVIFIMPICTIFLLVGGHLIWKLKGEKLHKYKLWPAKAKDDKKKSPNLIKISKSIFAKKKEDKT